MEKSSLDQKSDSLDEASLKKPLTEAGVPKSELLESASSQESDGDSEGVLDFEYTEQLSNLSIRLLSFNESEDDELNLRLDVFNFQDAPPYHALSYTWGSPYDSPNLELPPGDEEGWLAGRMIDVYDNLTKQIIVNDRALEVRLSLFEALKRLSTGIEDGTMQQKYLWADAICVNQNDNDEKMKQVLLMGDIYKKATSVIAWLGNPLEETQLALDVMSEIRKIDIKQLSDMKQLSHDDPAAYEKLGIRNITEREWRAFCGFSRRNWFSRIWIVQEGFFARDIVLVTGPFTIFKMSLGYVYFLLWQSSWSAAIIQPYYHQFSIQSKTGARIGSFISTFLMEYGDSPLEAFSSFRSYNASDPRDKVYALLNVIASRCKKEPSALPILPDYNRALPDVLLEATRYCLSFHRDLRFFWYIENEQHRRLPECPSWMIDLPKIMCRYPFALSDVKGELWNPSGETVRENPDNSTPHLLKFKAAKVCDIEQLSTGTIYTTQEVFDFRSFLYVALHLGPEYGTDMGQGVTEILWRTITADRVADEYPAPAIYAPAIIIFFVDDFLRRLKSSPETKADDEMQVSVQLAVLHNIDPGTIMPDAHQLMTLLQTGGPQLTVWQTETHAMVASTTHAAGNRLLARTSSNHLGLVPSNAEVGDEVFVMPGMPTPFVFRPLKNGNHELIGEAYVHGIMRGEKADKLQFEEVVLE